MKKHFFILSILSVFFINSCDQGLEEGCVQVKLINQICGNAILQVVGGDVPEGIANTWTSNDGVTYQNVFTTFLNSCEFFPSNGDTFLVKIIDEMEPSHCAVCLAMLADAPDQFLYTKITNECEIVGNDF